MVTSEAQVTPGHGDRPPALMTFRTFRNEVARESPSDFPAGEALSTKSGTYGNGRRLEFSTEALIGMLS